MKTIPLLIAIIVGMLGGYLTSFGVFDGFTGWRGLPFHYERYSDLIMLGPPDESGISRPISDPWKWPIVGFDLLFWALASFGSAHLTNKVYRRGASK